jgi:hypothetical protein
MLFGRRIGITFFSQCPLSVPSTKQQAVNCVAETENIVCTQLPVLWLSTSIGAATCQLFFFYEAIENSKRLFKD